MDFNRTWTQFALDAEAEHCGFARIAVAHNALRTECERLRAELAEAVTALPQAVRNERERCATIAAAGADGTSAAYADACRTVAALIRAA